MVLKTKRNSANVEEEGSKRKRREDKSDDSNEAKKKSKKDKEYVVKVKEDRLSDDEEVEEEDKILHAELDREDAGDTLPWPLPDMLELLNRIEGSIPANDSLSFATRAERIDWDEMAFNHYTPADCKNVWMHVQKRLRKFRLLKELIFDARQWVHKPWTNFYSGAKQNQHPDMPRRPLNPYMLYYMEKKDKVAALNPNLDMTNLSKIVSGMFNALAEHKKEKYEIKAKELQDEYQEKLRLFYEKHPECRENKRSKDTKSQSLTPGGPKKPRTPLQIFVDEKVSKVRDNPNFRKSETIEVARQQWKSLSDKKRLVWINWALDEENKYQESLKLYMAENPDFQPPPFKSVLKKEEVILRDRAAGKPAKPPNSAYSLYSRIMLSQCPRLRELVPKDRMKEISIQWHNMPDSEKADYDKKVKHEQAKFKLEYATYLDSLSPEERQEELMRNQVKKKKVDVVEPKEIINNGNKSKSKSKKSSKKGPDEVNKKKERSYFPGEPHQPPVNAYELFVDSFVNDTKLSAAEAPRFWDILPSSDKAKFQRKLKELKEKYIKDYRKFLKSLDEEQVAKYNELQKRNKEKELAAESQTSHGSDNDDSDDSSSENESRGPANNVGNENNDSDSDEEEDKKSGSSSDTSSSSSESSSSSSSSDSDSSSDDSDDEDKTTNQNNVKKENSDSDSSDDD